MKLQLTRWTRVRRPQRHELYGVLGVAAFMLALALLDAATNGFMNLPALVPPFGASAVIAFYTPESPVGRPWNVVVGHLCAAFAACSALWLLPEAAVGVQAAAAVSSAGLLMVVTQSFHPPGGATALLAVVSTSHLGFWMLISPMLVGAILLVAIRYTMDQLPFAAQRLQRGMVLVSARRRDPGRRR